MSSQLKRWVIIFLLLSLLAGAATTAFASAANQTEQDIVDTAIADGRFTTLVKALETADLIDTLKGEGPFTVFAPTDEAFAALPDGVLDDLMADLPALTDVLLYHVVPGKVMAADVATMSSADTVLGESAPISTSDGNVRVGDANVIVTDIEASNGVIHVIDTVLLPKAVEASIENGTLAEDKAMAEGEATMEDEAVVEGKTTMEDEVTVEDEASMESDTTMTNGDTVAESSTTAESETPPGLPSTGGHLVLMSFIIVGLVLIGMILALGGLALRVGIGIIK
ncbi:MAG: fasciclin domain-containing protein [Anaerolineaceae bacterium]|nr:fasciclin domain-containing protein [Anaerolineaceae bacterium]